ncbi:MAG: hypothetical protein VB934_02005 [Polyangiaceae bacterium]
MARILAALAVFALGSPGCQPDSEPDPLVSDAAATLGGTATTSTGRYRVAVRPARDDVVLGEIHEWIAQVERSDGSTPSTLYLDLDGGMPSHGHGFVTDPRVTRDLGDGSFLVEGVKFHMAGAWELYITVGDEQGRDRATVPITVTP